MQLELQGQTVRHVGETLDVQSIQVEQDFGAQSKPDGPTNFGPQIQDAGIQADKSDL